MKFFYIINIFEIQFFDNNKKALLTFFLIFAEMCFVSWRKYCNLIFDETCKRYFCASFRSTFYELSNMLFLILLFFRLFFRISGCQTFVILKWRSFQYNANFFKKGILVLQHPVYDFSRENFLMLCSNKLTNFTVWLPLLLEILRNLLLRFPASQFLTSKVFKQPYLSDQFVFILDQQVNILRT